MVTIKLTPAYVQRPEFNDDDVYTYNPNTMRVVGRSHGSKYGSAGAQHLLQNPPIGQVAATGLQCKMRGVQM